MHFLGTERSQVAATSAHSAAERSYPTSKVRGSGLECQAAMAQERQRGATLCPRSGAAGRSQLMPKPKGSDPEEPPRARGQRWQLGGATHARGQGRRPGGATRGAVAMQAQEGLEELYHVEGQELWR